MTFDPHIVLPFGLLGLYVGFENLVMYRWRRVRLHLWLGLTGLTAAPYAYACFGLYSASDVIEGGRWQHWQLLFASMLSCWLALLGLDYLGKLRRELIVGILGITVVADVLLWAPGLGLANVPAVKRIEWLNVTYHEWALGPVASGYFVLSTVVLVYLAVSTVRRAWRGSWAERSFAAVFVGWFLASMNDTAVAAGLLQSIYLVEYSFVLVAALFGTLLSGDLHRAGLAAEQERNRLAIDAVHKDHQLAAAQAELVVAAKLAAVGRLAAGVAHEVNNPLAYVMSNLHALAGEAPADSEQATLAKEALHGAERIKAVVRQLSAFARPAGEEGTGRVGAAVDAAVRMASVATKDCAMLHIDVPELPPVTMNESHLAQVLLNLIVNSAQSIAPGHRMDNWIRVTARQAGDRVTIACEDSGPGIAEQVLPELFGAFVSTKPVGAGVGLGLATSRELVLRAGGTIRGENVAGGGARFTVELPIVETSFSKASTPPAQGLTAPARGRGSDQARPSLLLVEDEPKVARAVARLVSAAYAVQTVAGGRQAQRLLAAGNDFDVILSDLMMPDGSGLELLDWLAENRPELARRLILVTGAGAALQSAAKAHPAKPWILEKPFDLDELQRAVEHTHSRSSH